MSFYYNGLALYIQRFNRISIQERGLLSPLSSSYFLRYSQGGVGFLSTHKPNFFALASL